MPMATVAAEQQDEATATLEGQVIDAQQEVTAADTNLKAAEQDAEANLTPEDRTEVDQTETELDGQVVDEEKTETVVKKKEKKYRRAETELTETDTPENRKKVDETKRDYDGSLLDYDETESKIYQENKEIVTIERRTATGEVKERLETAEKEETRAYERLAREDTKLRTAMNEEGPETTGGTAESQIPVVPLETETYFRSGEVEIRAFGIYAGGRSQGRTERVRTEHDVKTDKGKDEDDEDDEDEDHAAKKEFSEEDFTDRAINANGLGAGGAMDYFFTRYFGAGVEGDWVSGYRDLGLVVASLIARYPVEGKIAFAPYATLGGGGQFGDGSHGILAMGGGVEARITPNLGVFTDLRWIYSGHENLAFLTFGVSWSFGGESNSPR